MEEQERQNEIADEAENDSESSDILNKKVGNEIRQILEPKNVKIMKVEVRAPKPESKNKIAVFHCSHPDCKERLGVDTIEISQVKAENMRTHKMEISGLWVNLDSKEELQKGSALANFISFLNVATLKDCVGKEVQTVARENNFLAFKGY